MKRERRGGHSIFFKMLSVYLISNTALLILFGSLMMTSFSYNMKREVRRYNEIIAEQMRYRVDSIYDNVISSMVQFASVEEVGTALAKAQVSGVEKMRLDRLVNRYLKKTESTLVSDIMVLGVNGYSYSYLARDRMSGEYDFRQQAWFQEAIDTAGGRQYVHVLGLHGQEFYSEAVFARTALRDTFSVSMALTDLNREVIGTLVYNFDVDKFGEMLSSNNYEQDYQLLLADGEQRILAASCPELAGQAVGLSGEDWEKISALGSGTIMAKTRGVYSMVNVQETAMGWKLVSTVPVSSISAHLYPIYLLFFLLLLCCLLLNGVIVWRISRSLHRPIMSLVGSLQTMDFDNLQTNRERYEYEEITFIQEKFNEVILRLDDYIKKDLKSQLYLSRFRLDSLQAQINPHFLMNTLQLLQTEIVYGNIKESNAIIVSLSRMLHYSLYDPSNMVTIGEELSYIRSYLELFRRKYEDRLEIVCDVDEAALSYYMPKLLLQPLVENCIKHAFNENPQQAVIVLEIRQSGEDISFAVQDNGMGIASQKLVRLQEELEAGGDERARIGIKNVDQRIRLLFGARFHVEISSRQEHGTEIRFLIPKITAQARAQYEGREHEAFGDR